MESPMLNMHPETVKGLVESRKFTAEFIVNGTHDNIIELKQTLLDNGYFEGMNFDTITPSYKLTWLVCHKGTVTLHGSKHYTYKEYFNLPEDYGKVLKLALTTN
jgi:hypothetical protein